MSYEPLTYWDDPPSKHQQNGFLGEAGWAPTYS